MDFYIMGIVIMFGYFGCMAFFSGRRASLIGHAKTFHFIFIALLATFLLITGQGRSQSMRDTTRNSIAQSEWINDIEACN